MKIAFLLPAALAFGLNALAADAPMPAADQGATAADTSTAYEKLKAFKEMQFKAALTKAGVDDATQEKVMNNLNALRDEKKAKFKELKEAFKAKVKTALTDAGLTQEKADEVIAAYKEQVKGVREKIKAAIHEFIEQMKAGQQAPAETPAATPTTEQPAAAPATQPAAASGT